MVWSEGPDAPLSCGGLWVAPQGRHAAGQGGLSPRSVSLQLMGSAFGKLCPAVTPQVLLPELTHLGVGAWLTARPDSKSLTREAVGFHPHHFTWTAPKDTVCNAVIAAGSTPPSQYHQHVLPGMGTGPTAVPW